MTIIKQKTKQQQRREGWIILAVAAAIVIAMSFGLSPTDFLGYD